jgi:hypothetical protein
MSKRFTPWPDTCGRYGAPMGRASANLALDPEHDSPESLAVAGPAGEYDAGGAYWGLGGGWGPVWAVWRRGKGPEGVMYVRARSRDAAKRVALA